MAVMAIEMRNDTDPPIPPNIPSNHLPSKVHRLSIELDGELTSLCNAN